MQAPSAHQVTHARLQRCTLALQQGFARLQSDLEPLTRQSKQLARQAARDGQLRTHEQGAQGQGGGLLGSDQAAAAGAGPQLDHAMRAEGPAAAASAAQAAAMPAYLEPYAATVDLESPSLGTLRAPLAAPLPEVMAAAAVPLAGPAGGVAVRRHLTDADRARWNKLDRILSHQFSSLQRIKYSALPQEYLQRLHQQMHGPPAPAAPPATAAPADAAA